MFSRTSRGRSRAQPDWPLSVPRAAALGLLHGPAELLPISSSAHVTLVPWLLGWDLDRLEPDVRKSFEVALHAATAAALAIALRAELGAMLARPHRRRWLELIALATAPAALAGYVLERPIEARLGTPATIATGLLLGSASLAVADLRPQARTVDDAGAGDALWLGMAQAGALAPGISRGGATLTAARLRRFERESASRLSRQVALPVIAGASALKTVRLARRGLPAGAAFPFAAGAAASFVSTLVSKRLIDELARDRSFLPFALYRSLLALATLGKLRTGRPRGRSVRLSAANLLS
jgi:undecaprenyl-diphosphatase